MTDVIKQLDNEINKYLCYDKYLQFVFHCGEDGLVICEPYSGRWMVSYYKNNIQERTDLVDTLDEAFLIFQKFCSQSVKDKNMEYQFGN